MHLTKDQLDDLRALRVEPAPDDPALFVVNGVGGTAEVTLSIHGDLLLTVNADGPFPEGRARFTPQQARELCVAILAVTKLVEDH